MRKDSSVTPARRWAGVASWAAVAAGEPVSTPVGRWGSVVEGKTARATPAGFDTWSGTPIRVVLLVAKAGKASASGTCGDGSPLSLPEDGAEVVTSLPLLLSSPPVAKTIAAT